jgi:hypothetical protein
MPLKTCWMGTHSRRAKTLYIYTLPDACMAYTVAANQTPLATQRN